MKLRIIVALFLFICASVSTVSAAEPPETYERLTIEKARAAAEWHCDTIIGSDDRDRLEVREIVPCIFVSQIYKFSYTPAEMMDEASTYLAFCGNMVTPNHC